MNLHAIASAMTRAVSPPITVTIHQSIGAAENDDGRTVPQYAAPVVVQGDKQSLTGSDVYRLTQLQSLSVQGVVCKMYLHGNYEGLFRVTGKGGDLLTFDGQTYLVGAVLERFPDWCCLALVMQLDGPDPT